MVQQGVLSYLDTMDCIFVDKPEGWSTHSPGLGHRGLVELYSSRLNLPLLVAHRLDKTTSGALVFAKTGAAAEYLRVAFQEHRVKKSYLFVTDQSSTESEFSAESEIEKQGNGFFSKLSRTPNAFTSFRRVKRSPFFELWEAFPRSGKPHQIRLHAQQIGLSILGDELYGGSAFPRLCLHARDLEIPNFPKWRCPPPRIFERLGLLKDPELCAVLSAIDQRQRVFGFLGTGLGGETDSRSTTAVSGPVETLRLMDFDLGSGLALDLLGPQLWLHWYRDQDPTPRDLERWSLVSWILGRPMVIQKRVNRGAQIGPASRWEIGEPVEKWVAAETNGSETSAPPMIAQASPKADSSEFKVKYNFRKSQGESYGLFLDQRLNRTRLAEMGRGKSVLNLFAYTGGFGIAAGLRGARDTTTVDLSSSTVDWARENFAANGLTGPEHEFFAADCFFFLDRALKRGRTWDLIVCDPPIFSRSKEQVFRVEKDFARLIGLCERALNPGGWLLFSTHYSGWSQEALRSEIKKKFRGLVVDGQFDIDYSKEHPLKSYWLQKLD